jgi:hypothetical protein
MNWETWTQQEELAYYLSIKSRLLDSNLIDEKNSELVGSYIQDVMLLMYEERLPQIAMCSFVTCHKMATQASRIYPVVVDLYCKEHSHQGASMYVVNERESPCAFSKCGGFHCGSVVRLIALSYVCDGKLCCERHAKWVPASQSVYQEEFDGDQWFGDVPTKCEMPFLGLKSLKRVRSENITNKTTKKTRE